MIQYTQLAPQIDQLAIHANDAQAQVTELLKLARSWLQEHASRFQELQAPAREYRTAIPTNENLLAAHPAPSMPQRFTVMGSDGSSIAPDRHGTALYYLINVGSLTYRHSSGQTPLATSRPDLRFEECDLYEDRMLVDDKALEIRRSIAEIRQLADAAEAELCKPDVPTIGLVDGTLLLWAPEGQVRDRQCDKIREFLVHLERLHKTRMATCSFVSRPRAHDVVKLIWLAHLQDRLSKESMEANPLFSLPDRLLFEFLQPGERSTCFENSSAANRIYAEAGHSVHFFYLNVGDKDTQELARVEVPEWVYHSPTLLDQVHGAILAQCKLVGAYPYVLTRAHELAIVSGDDRARVNEMVEIALLKQGLVRQSSQKAMLKTMVSGRKRKLG